MPSWANVILQGMPTPRSGTMSTSQDTRLSRYRGAARRLGRLGPVERGGCSVSGSDPARAKGTDDSPGSLRVRQCGRTSAVPATSERLEAKADPGRTGDRADPARDRRGLNFL